MPKKYVVHSNRKLPPIETLTGTVKHMASLGFYDKDIARALNVTPEYFCNLKAKYPELLQAYNQGLHLNVNRCQQVLFDALDSKDERVRVDAAKWLLKHRHSWTEKIHVETQVTIAHTQLDALTDEQLHDMLTDQEQIVH